MNKLNKFKILSFFNKEYKGPKGRIIFMASISTITYSIQLACINEAAQMIGNVNMRLFFLYITICVALIICKHYTLTSMTKMAEEVVCKVRVRLTDKLRHTELQFMERSEKGYIYARVAQDTEYISQSATDVINVFETFFTSVFIYLYVAVISPVSFVLTIAFMLALAGVSFLNYREIRECLNAAGLKEGDFFDALNDTISGFKEIKINQKKNNALFADTEALSVETEQLKINAGFKNNKNIVSAFACYEGLLGIVVFAVPLFSHAHSDVIIKLVIAMISVFGMLSGLARGIPVMAGANVAVENVERLEADIDDFGALTSVIPQDIPLNFHKITLHSVAFRYTDKAGEPLFTLGPVELTIRQGEILFIVGGNGSGKSTLLKLLTGLYYPMADDGFITLNDNMLTPDNYQAYRELFSIIFTDFHMFKKLYGLESVDENQVKDLLKQMDVHTKTDYAEGRFTNIDLSTGQKKRLAYIAALLEDKQIYVFDEWAADQDPVFRRHFYERFLEDLRAMNKTIIAVTHDDRYFDVADRVLKMEEGKLVLNG